jgi:hypothetical protein
MADDQIKHRISLEGADDVAKKLRDIGDAGNRAFKEVKQYTEDGSSGIGKLGTALQSFRGHAEAGNEIATKFRETLHTIHPILDQAGLGLSNLGAFAGAARVGLGGLAIAITGSVLIGLAKLADEAANAKKRLSDLLQNPEAGKKLFEGIEDSAKRLGTTASNLTPAIEKLIEARQKLYADKGIKFAPGVLPSSESPFAALSNANITSASEALFRQMQVGRASTEEARAALLTYNTELAKTGQLTPAAVQAIADASPGAANDLAKSLQRGFVNYQDTLKALNNGVKISTDEILRDVNRVAPAWEAAAKAIPRSFDQATEHLQASFKSLFKSVETDANNTTKVIDRVGDALDQLNRRAKENIKPQEIPPTSLFGRLLGLSEKTPNTRIEEGFGQLPKKPAMVEASAVGDLSTPFKTSPPGELETKLTRDMMHDVTPFPINMLPPSYDKNLYPDGKLPKGLPKYQDLSNPDINARVTPDWEHRPQNWQPPAGTTNEDARNPKYMAPNSPEWAPMIRKDVQDYINENSVPGDASGIKVRPIDENATPGKRSDASGLGWLDVISRLISTPAAAAEIKGPLSAGPGQQPVPVEIRGPISGGGAAPAAEGIAGSADQAKPSVIALVGAVDDLAKSAGQASDGLKGMKASLGSVGDEPRQRHQDALDAGWSEQALADAHKNQFGYASGGAVHGPGTGKSDSIFARLSRGEFVVTADGSNLGDAVRHFAPGFADGGFAVPDFSPSAYDRVSIPKLAPAVGSSPSSSGSLGHHTIDLRTDHGDLRGFLAKEDLYKELSSMSVRAQVRSGGKKPSWYK